LGWQPFAGHGRSAAHRAGASEVSQWVMSGALEHYLVFVDCRTERYRNYTELANLS